MIRRVRNVASRKERTKTDIHGGKTRVGARRCQLASQIRRLHELRCRQRFGISSLAGLGLNRRR